MKSIVLTAAMLCALSSTLPTAVAPARAMVALKVESFRHYRKAFNRFHHE